MTEYGFPRVTIPGIDPRRREPTVIDTTTYPDLIQQYVMRQRDLIRAVEDLTLVGVLARLPWMTRYLCR